MARPEKIRLGDLLVQQKLISNEQLKFALDEQKRSGRKLGRVLVDNAYVTEDNISEAGLFPRIGEYDRWAIQWGYTPTAAIDEKADEKITNKWILDSLGKNPRLWFGTEVNPFDPRSQTEDLGDNNMKASEYGIKNLQRIITNLGTWTKEEADKYE